MIYVCVPARNEARTLGPLLWKVRKVLGEFGREFRLVVFDDGSSDDTAAVLERYTGVLPLTVLRDENGVGYGVAVDRMLRHVVEVAPYPKRDSAVVLQGDFSENPEFIVDLIKTLEGGVDVVASSVSVGVEGIPKPRVWGRRLAPWVLGRAWRKAPVEDPVSGYRAYRVIVLKKALRETEAPLSASSEPWVASLELLRRVVPFARRVEETPIRLRYPLPSRDSRFRTVRVLKELFGVRGGRWPAIESGMNGKKKGSGDGRSNGAEKKKAPDRTPRPKSEGRSGESDTRPPADARSEADTPRGAVTETVEAKPATETASDRPDGNDGQSSGSRRGRRSGGRKPRERREDADTGPNAEATSASEARRSAAARAAGETEEGERKPRRRRRRGGRGRRGRGAGGEGRESGGDSKPDGGEAS